MASPRVSSLRLVPAAVSVSAASGSWICVSDTLTFLQPPAERSALRTLLIQAAAAHRGGVRVLESGHLRHTSYHNTDSKATAGTRGGYFKGRVCVSAP